MNRSRSRSKGRRQKGRYRSASRENKYGSLNDSKRRKDTSDLDDDPIPGKVSEFYYLVIYILIFFHLLQIYNGKVANIVNFGCFVQIEGLRKRWEGLVHISQLRAQGRVSEVSEVVSRGMKIKVRHFSEKINNLIF